jgi:hypothetical protein
MNVCIIGNKEILDEDYSSQVASADIVVRISKMCNYDSGLTGSCTDILYLEPNWNWPWYSEKRRHTHLFKDIPVIRIRESWWVRTGCHLRDSGYVEKDQVEIIPKSVESIFPGFTTFALAVADMNRRHPRAHINLVAADVGDARLEFLRLFHPHSQEVQYIEDLAEKGILEAL